MLCGGAADAFIRINLNERPFWIRLNALVAIRSASGETVAVISKELFNWSDTYAIDAPNPSDALPVLLVALAIDAEKCSRGD